MAAGTGRFARSSERPSPLAIGVLALGVLAAILMLISLFSTIASVDVANGSCEVINDANPELADRCSLSGFERHSIAFLLLAVICLALAYGAGVGRSRPAAFGLLAVGAIALILALLVDLPVTDDTGAIGRDFEGATASAGTGLGIEVVSGVLALAAGGLALLLPPPPSARRPSERPGGAPPARSRQRSDRASGSPRRSQRSEEAEEATRPTARAKRSGPARSRRSSQTDSED
jgi:hypothetical protein